MGEAFGTALALRAKPIYVVLALRASILSQGYFDGVLAGSYRGSLGFLLRFRRSGGGQVSRKRRQSLERRGHTSRDDHNFHDNGGATMALVRGLAMMGWQSIKTAPKDGTVILLWGGMPDGAGSDELEDVPYEEGGWGRHVWKKPRPVSAWWDRYGWRFCSYDLGCYGEYDEPTHWMPLPDPPASPDP